VLTLFTIPKAFNGHIAVIQRNAIQSWMRLHPEIEIILFGADEGTAEAAREFGLRYEPELAAAPGLHSVKLFRRLSKFAQSVPKLRGLWNRTALRALYRLPGPDLPHVIGYRDGRWDFL